jgi:8-oxo-dGTP pyrophosphatase MutT (NUDIX family)
MQSGAMSVGDPQASNRWTPTRMQQPSAKFFRLSQLRRMRGSEQVAAVCYRTRGDSIEFLLVQTRAGRWTFPKGHAEPGLSHAQAAALEAFEEAGVHGRMEEISFTRYVRRKRTSKSASEKGLGVNAHLCEVLRLGAPQESGRNPSWFSAEKTKRRLREARTPDYALELARVVDRAVTRIQSMYKQSPIDRPRLDGPKFERPRLDRLRKDAQPKVHVMIESPRPALNAAKVSGTARKARRNIIQIDRF